MVLLLMLQLSVFSGLSRSHVKFYALSRTATREAHLPLAVQARSFSESVVCFASKENTPTDGSSDEGKVLFFFCFFFFAFFFCLIVFFCSNTALSINNIYFQAYQIACKFPSVFQFHSFSMTVWSSSFPVLLEKCTNMKYFRNFGCSA